MKVIGWSPNLTPERAASAGVEYVPTKEQLLQQSDIVSLHLVLSERSTDTINEAEFKLMKPSAFIINTSRGPLINESALVEALKNKTIRGAGLDVFDQEPLPLDHPLRSLDNVTLSPHTGYVSDTNYEVCSFFLDGVLLTCIKKVFWKETVENVQAYVDGKPRALM